MKKYKIFNKTGLAICLTLGLVVGSACSPTDDGPSIDDHFLNYEIPQIRPTGSVLPAIRSASTRTLSTTANMSGLITE